MLHGVTVTFRTNSPAEASTTLNLIDLAAIAPWHDDIGGGTEFES